MARLMLIDREFARSYLQKTGQKPPGSLVTEQDFQKLNTEANAPQQPAVPSTFTDPTQAVKRVVDAVGAAKATGTNVSGMTTEQARGLVDQGLGAGLVQDANKPKQEPAADVSGVPATPVQPEQPMTFVDFLKSLGIGMPQTPQFSFDPQAAYNAALAEAELAIGPQRDALQFNTNRRIADTRARGEARVKSLKESQAQRRMFGSPAGLTAENMLHDETEQAIRGAESERDMRLSGLEQQKALRALTGAQRMERDAYSDYARALSSTQQQFNSLVGLWDKAADNARADKKQQAEVAKWLGTLEIQRMNAETNAAYRAGQLAQGEAKIAQGDARLALDEAKLVVKVEQDAAKLMQGWAKIRSANMAKFGIKAGNLFNQAMDAAMQGDAEGADALLAEAHAAWTSEQAAKEGRKDARAEQTALMSTFRSMTTKYGPQVASYIVAGLQAANGDEQAKWFGVAEEAIAAQEGDKQAAILARQQAMAEFNASLSAARQQTTAREATRRAYTQKFGPEIAADLLYAEELEDAGMEDVAAEVRAGVGPKVEAALAKGNKNDSSAWKGFMVDLNRLVSQVTTAIRSSTFEGIVNPVVVQKQVQTAIDPILQRWVPMLTDDEAEALKGYLIARGYWQPD